MSFCLQSTLISCKAVQWQWTPSTFVCSGKSLSLLHFWRTALLAIEFLIGNFFLLIFRIYFPILSWPETFLLSNPRIGLWEFPYILLLSFLLLVLCFTVALFGFILWGFHESRYFSPQVFSYYGFKYTFSFLSLYLFLQFL